MDSPLAMIAAPLKLLAFDVSHTIPETNHLPPRISTPRSRSLRNA
jgi:hypothetical protein